MTYRDLDLLKVIHSHLDDVFFTLLTHSPEAATGLNEQ